MRKDKGFSLAEVALGLAVVGIATAAIIGWQVNEQKHAKVRELASTMQALDTGLYQINALLNHIPVSQSQANQNTTTPEYDSIYGCILRNTDSWRGVVQAPSQGGGLGNGMVLGDDVMWFEKWDDVVRYFNSVPATEIVKRTKLVSNNASSWEYYGVFLSTIEPALVRIHRVGSNWYANNMNLLCKSRNNYNGYYVYYGYRNNFMCDNLYRFLNNSCGVLFFTEIHNSILGGELVDYSTTPAFVYIDCANGGSNPRPSMLPNNSNNPNNPSNPTNPFNPTDVLPSNLLDPRIDLRRLALQGFRFTFNRNGNTLASITLTTDAPDDDLMNTLAAMLGDKAIKTGANSLTYFLNNRRGYSVQTYNFTCY